MGKRKNPAIEASDILIGIKLLAIHEFTSHGLSRRQCQIAFLLFQGDSGKLIAKRLYITTSCVRYHISEIYAKTRSKNREDFLHTIWKGIRVSNTSWESRDDLIKERNMHIANSSEWYIQSTDVDTNK